MTEQNTPLVNTDDENLEPLSDIELNQLIAKSRVITSITYPDGEESELNGNFILL
jgi:hypothetical protein